MGKKKNSSPLVFLQTRSWMKYFSQKNETKADTRSGKF